MLIITTKPKFLLGDIVITANAQARLSPSAIQAGLCRHAQGDWGDLDGDDAQMNELALLHGDRLLSAYGTDQDRFWIITEADRSYTTILLPEDY